MIRFILKGILRDRSRSLLPITIVSIGVILTVVLTGYLNGVFEDVVRQNAAFDTGHVKITTRAYSDNEAQKPLDLALLDVSGMMDSLEEQYASILWVPRIQFGGLIDAGNGTQSRSQGPAVGMAYHLLDESFGEIDRLNLRSSIERGDIPDKLGEILVGEEFASRLNLTIGDTISFFGSTMHGSMTFRTFEIAGTVRFGTVGLNRSAIIMDIEDAREALDMSNASNEILGFFSTGEYDSDRTDQLTAAFNRQHSDQNDEFSPIMRSLRDQNGLGEVIDYSKAMSGMFIGIFLFAMSIVLWNTGLLAGLRRYQEFGIRLALGESKGFIYRSLLLEAVIVGIIGSVIGTTIGLAITWYMQEVGIDLSDFMQESTMIMPSVFRSKISPNLFYIGFIPGLFAMVMGTGLSGIGIFKRETARLIKELEV
jgi:putative ABC transport system permease protein